jgi:hypothetical protein
MKKYLLGIVAVLLAVGFSAFTQSEKKTSAPTNQNFTYNDYPDDTWVGDASHYTLISGSLSCSGTSHRCGVSAQNDGTDHPILSGATVFTKN